MSAAFHLQAFSEARLVELEEEIASLREINSHQSHQLLRINTLVSRVLHQHSGDALLHAEEAVEQLVDKYAKLETLKEELTAQVHSLTYLHESEKSQRQQYAVEVKQNREMLKNIADKVELDKYENLGAGLEALEETSSEENVASYLMGAPSELKEAVETAIGLKDQKISRLLNVCKSLEEKYSRLLLWKKEHHDRHVQIENTRADQKSATGGATFAELRSYREVLKHVTIINFVRGRKVKMKIMLLHRRLSEMLEELLTRVDMSGEEDEWELNLQGETKVWLQESRALRNWLQIADVEMHRLLKNLFEIGPLVLVLINKAERDRIRWCASAESFFTRNSELAIELHTAQEAVRTAEIRVHTMTTTMNENQQEFEELRAKYDSVSSELGNYRRKERRDRKLARLQFKKSALIKGHGVFFDTFESDYTKYCPHTSPYAFNPNKSGPVPSNAAAVSNSSKNATKHKEEGEADNSDYEDDYEVEEGSGSPPPVDVTIAQVPIDKVRKLYVEAPQPPATASSNYSSATTTGVSESTPKRSKPHKPARTHAAHSAPPLSNPHHATAPSDAPSNTQTTSNGIYKATGKPAPGRRGATPQPRQKIAPKPPPIPPKPSIEVVRIPNTMQQLYQSPYTHGGPFIKKPSSMSTKDKQAKEAARKQMEAERYHPTPSY